MTIDHIIHICRKNKEIITFEIESSNYIEISI